MEQQVSEANVVEDDKLTNGGLDLTQEKEIAFQDFVELVQFGKPANFTFYIFSRDERLFSFTFSGDPDTYLKELTYSAILLSLIDHPKFLFIYNSFLPYMGGIEKDAIVTGVYEQHEDLDLEQIPYEVVDSEFVNLKDKLTINPSVSLISDEILVTLKTIKLAHFTDKHSMIATAIEFLESCGIEFCYYGNTTKMNIEEKLNRHYIIEDFKTAVLNNDQT
jgi:hypothetical protein